MSRPVQRALVVGALFVLSLILYIDRACIAVAKDAMSAELGFTEPQMGLVFGSFALGYALAQIPAGWLADRHGPRLMLAAAVMAWSALTGITGVVHALGTMVVVRFLFGVGEAGAFPATARVLYGWLPPGRRGIANGLVFSGSRLGAAIAYPLLSWMIAAWGWRSSFWVLAAIGILWAVLWALFFRDEPATPNTEPVRDELAYGRIFRSPSLLLAMGQYFASNFTFFIGLSWMLPYLTDRFGLDAATAARYAMVPLLFAATSQWISGFLVDALYRCRMRAWSRRLPAMVGFALAACGLVAITLAQTPAAVVACFTLAVFGTDMTISPSWSFCVDLAGRGSGAVSGAMNMIGNLGAFVSASAFPLLLNLTGNSGAYFWVAAALNVAAIACWWRMAPPPASVPATS